MLAKAIRLFFTFNVVLLVMLGVTLPFQDPGSEPYVVSVLALVVVVASVLASGLLIYFDVPSSVEWA